MTVRDHAPLGAPCWIDVFTSDAEGARAFYAALFGWTAEEPNEEFGGYWNFQKDGRRIAGGMTSDPSSGMPDAWSVYLSVAEAQAAADLALANGGQVMVPPMAVGELGTMAVLVDPGGAAIGIWQSGEHRGFLEYEVPGTPSWFELHTRDYATSLAFYSAVFGWEPFAMGDTDEFRYSVAQGEGQIVGVMDAVGFLPEGVPAHWSIYFEVADVDVALARVGELGGATILPGEDTPYGRLAQAADPTGAVFKLRTTPAETDAG